MRIVLLLALAVALSITTILVAREEIAPVAAPATVPTELSRAIFAGGCFWCMESEFESIDGIVDVVAGYSGGDLPNPTYKQVSTGRTGHYEVIEVSYDPARVDYGRLLEVYWSNVDPTVGDRQFCDIGPQYRSAIFVATDGERAAAEASRAAIAADPRFAGQTIHTAILDAAPFWRAEEEHQDFAKRNPMRYQWYLSGCGRNARLREVWGSAPEG